MRSKTSPDLHSRRILAQTHIDCPSRRDNEPWAAFFNPKTDGVPYRGMHCMERASRGCLGSRQINKSTSRAGAPRYQDGAGDPLRGQRRRASVVRQLRFPSPARNVFSRSPPYPRHVIHRCRRATGMMPSRAVSPMFLSGLFTPAARVLANAPETGDYLFMRTASGNQRKLQGLARRAPPQARRRIHARDQGNAIDRLPRLLNDHHQPARSAPVTACPCAGNQRPR